MTDYKPSTRPVRFQNRTAFDPSDRMFAESKAKTAVDQSMLKDMEKTSKDVGKAHELWDKNLTLLDKEEVEFISTVSKTLTQALGTTVPQLMKLHLMLCCL